MESTQLHETFRLAGCSCAFSSTCAHENDRSSRIKCEPYSTAKHLKFASWSLLCISLWAYFCSWQTYMDILCLECCLVVEVQEDQIHRLVLKNGKTQTLIFINLTWNEERLIEFSDTPFYLFICLFIYCCIWSPGVLYTSDKLIVKWITRFSCKIQFNVVHFFFIKSIVFIYFLTSTRCKFAL